MGADTPKLTNASGRHDSSVIHYVSILILLLNSKNQVLLSFIFFKMCTKWFFVFGVDSLLFTKESTPLASSGFFFVWIVLGCFLLKIIQHTTLLVILKKGNNLQQQQNKCGMKGRGGDPRVSTTSIDGEVAWFYVSVLEFECKLSSIASSNFGTH